MLSSMHNDDIIDINSPQKKPEIVLCYNQTKSGVDTLDKLVREYSTRCATRRWPFVLFQSWLDIAAYNAFVLYTFKHPDRITGKSARRKFLKELGTMFAKPLIDRRAQAVSNNPKSHKKVTRRLLESCGATFTDPDPQDLPRNFPKRGRCYQCIGCDNKHSTICQACNKFFCEEHGTVTKTIICVQCLAGAESSDSDY
jgi:hypothetical protein